MTAYFIGRVLPIFTVLTFCAGMAWRILRWNRGARSKLTLFPAATARWGIWGDIFLEIVLFKTYLKSHRTVWAATWLMHASLFVILAGHCRLFADLSGLLGWLGLADGQVNDLGDAAGRILGAIALAAGLALLARRMLERSVREITTFEDLLVLGLLLAVILTGDALRFLTEFDVGQSRLYFRGFLRLEATSVPDHPLFLLHLFFVQALLVVTPFSKFLHAPGIFFSKPLVLRQ